MSKSVNLNANKKKAVISHLVMGSKVKNYILVKKKKQKLSIVKFSMNCVSMTDIVQMTRTITIK